MDKRLDTQSVGSLESQIVLYHIDDKVSLEVKFDAEQETVWLTQQQIADLFGTQRPAITKHLNNIFKSGELDKDSTCSILEHMGNDGKQKYSTIFYNLDVILSVGYRVNSINATAFRRWSTSILRQHIMRGYSFSQHLISLQERMDKRMLQIEDRQDKQQQQLDFFIQTSTPPAEMVFMEGDFYTARIALETLIRRAIDRVIIIDAYVSALTLDILDVRKDGVKATIFTNGVGQGMTRLMAEHDRLFPNNHIDIRRWKNESHDRWLIVDDQLYHCGHSLNANGGHKISAISLMGTSPQVILNEME